MSSSKPLGFIGRIKNLPSNNFSPSKTFHYEKEAIAAGILIFPNFVHAGLIFIPAIIGILFYLNTPWLLETDFENLSQVASLQHDNLIATLGIFKVLFIVLVGYFGVIKFQYIKQTGDYGYWLALGMDRLSFYNYNIAGFTMNGFFSMLVLFIHIFLVEKFYLPILNFAILVLLVLSSFYLFTNILYFVYEAIDNAEMTFLTVILIYIISIFFSGFENPLHSILNAELYFQDNSWPVLFGIQAIGGGILHYLGWRLHREIDVELGG